MQTPNIGNRAYELHNEVIRNEIERRRLLYRNMEAIHALHENNLFRAVLGDERAPWSAYLSQYEIFYSQSQVYQFDKIYQKFVKELGHSESVLTGIPVSKLASLVNVVTKENSQSWLDKATTLTSQDFQDELRIAQGKKSYLDCSHTNSKEYIICECGFKHKKNASAE